MPWGLRRARPLPYQPDAHGALGDDGRFPLTLANSGAASAHLTLYPYKGVRPVDEVRYYDHPEHFDVRGTDEVVFALAGEEYAFTVIGPNGFRREFGGRPGSAGAGLRVRSQIAAEPHRELSLTVHNPGTAPVSFDFGPTGEHAGTRSHTLKPGEETTVSWDTEAQHGWYDLTLTAGPGTAAVCHRRLMGHIENGAESVTG
ncbi:hypothetical protein A6A06_09095 [Streptomyces sp. CB02923]|nr:hypothetical protein A6A06_09095 [Streptomyces sp. CB02923]